MEITENDWNELKSMILEIGEGVKKLTDAANEELLTPTEVCRILKISRNTYQRYIDAKVFGQIKVGKNKNSRVFVKRSELERLIDEGKM